MFERLHMPPFAGAAEWLNSEPLGPAELRGHVVAGELLDADVHQLAAPGAVRPRVVAGLPRRRARRHRGPHAGVLLRARDRRHPAGDRGARDRLPGRGRQRLRDLERVRQPLLAGALLHRRRRASSATHHFGEGRYEQSERIIQRAARRAARARLRRRARRRGGRPTGTTCRRPRRISATGAASASRQPTVPRSASATPTSYPSALHVNHWALAGDWTDRARERRP